MLILTAYGGDGDEPTAIDAGANGYLVKPFEPDVLREMVDESLGGCLDV